MRKGGKSIVSKKTEILMVNVCPTVVEIVGGVSPIMGRWKDKKDGVLIGHIQLHYQSFNPL